MVCRARMFSTSSNGVRCIAVPSEVPKSGTGSKRLRFIFRSAGRKAKKADLDAVRKSVLDGLLRTLAGMPGARTATQESVHFEVDSIRDAMDSIKKLQGTGQLTINFANGKASGMAEWKTKPKP